MQKITRARMTIAAPMMAKMIVELNLEFTQRSVSEHFSVLQQVVSHSLSLSHVAPSFFIISSLSGMLSDIKNLRILLLSC